MAIRNIIQYDDERLMKRSREVDKINSRIKLLIEDLKQTLAEAGGIGIAAVQVGVLRRVAVINDNDEIIVLINPEIKKTEGEQEVSEGCLSFPGQFGIVKRPAEVTITAMNENGETIMYTKNELLARAFCHELDHMDGIVFVDKAERMLTPEEIEEMRKKEEEQ